MRAGALGITPHDCLFVASLDQQEGEKKANYWGSLCMASTVRLGNDARGNAVHVPLRNLLPTVHPNDLVLGGWDICSDNLADAMVKSSVLVRACVWSGVEWSARQK